MTDQSQHEDAVRLQITVDEPAHLTPSEFVRGVVEAVHQTQMMSYVAMAVDAERQSGHPRAQRQRSQSSDSRHPEPDEQENLLVEKVDWEHALDGVALNVGQPTDAEVTERHAWEPRRGGPVVAGHHRRQHVYTEQMKILTEKEVQSEQLTDNVSEEQQLDGDVDKN